MSPDHLGDDGTPHAGDGVPALSTARLRGVLDGTYARVNTARPGGYIVFLGDSITAGPDDNTNVAQGGSWPTLTAILSGQQVQRAYNAGIFGNTSAAMLARFDTDVTPYAPSAVTIAAGTNDTGNGVPFATFQANIQAIVAKVRAIGAVPILCTIPPTDSASPANRKGLIVQWNGWLKRYAALQGLTILDFYSVLVDPTTGGYKSALSSGDTIHPSAAGYLAMAQHAATRLSAVLPQGSTMPLCQDDNDLNSGIFKGCFGGYSGTSLPTGWTDGAGTPTGSAISYTTDSAVLGQMVTITSTASSGVRQLVYTAYVGSTTLTTSPAAGATSLTTAGRADRAGVLFLNPGGANAEQVKISSSSGGGPQTQTLAQALLNSHVSGETVIANALPGDVLIFSGVYTSDGAQAVRIGTACAGASYSPIAVSSVTAAVTRGVWAQRFTVPTGTTPTINFFVQVAAGTGVFSFGQVGVYNATRLGI